MSDDVNEYGLGAPNTQTDQADAVIDAYKGETEEPGIEHGLGPSDGPFLGESAPEEEGTRFGLGSDNTQEGDVVRAPDTEDEPDPLEHGLESTDVP